MDLSKLLDTAEAITFPSVPLQVTAPPMSRSCSMRAYPSTSHLDVPHHTATDPAPILHVHPDATNHLFPPKPRKEKYSIQEVGAIIEEEERNPERGWEDPRGTGNRKILFIGCERLPRLAEKNIILSNHHPNKIPEQQKPLRTTTSPHVDVVSTRKKYISPQQNWSKRQLPEWKKKWAHQSSDLPGQHFRDRFLHLKASSLDTLSNTPSYVIPAGAKMMLRDRGKELGALHAAEELRAKSFLYNHVKFVAQRALEALTLFQQQSHESRAKAELVAQQQYARLRRAQQESITNGSPSGK